MHIAFALFADAANVSQEGKLNILGVFDAIQVSSLPAVHPRATFVARVKGDPSEAGRHSVGLRWISPAGPALWSTDGTLEIAPPPPGLSTTLDLPLLAQLDLPLDSAGTYTLLVELDGTPSAEVQLRVEMAGALMPAQAPNGLLS